MGIRHIPGLIVATSLACAPLVGAAAQGNQPASADKTAASTTVGEVVVKGARKTKPSAAFQQAVSGFVAAQSQPSHIGLLARYMTPVCPSVVGLTQRFAEYISQRITEVAAQAGAPRGSCLRSNVRVVFTSQPQKLMDYVRAKDPGLLGYHFLQEERTLAAFQGPIDAWHMTGTRGWDGASWADDATNQKDPNVAKGGHYATASLGAGRLRGTVSSEFLFALVVVDSARVEKLPIGRIADQIAMMVLTNPKRSRTCSALPTLLDSLNPDCPASASLVSFSPYDEALLKGLYASDAQATGATQRNDIAQRIEANGPPPPAPPASAIPPAPAPATNGVNAVWIAHS